MEINNIKWTEKSILTGKTLFVIPLALVINSVLFRLGDSLLYRLLPISAVYTAAMWVFCGVSLAASTILSIKVLKFFYNKMLERMDADTAAEYLRRESKFKWHLLFTIGLYFLTMMVIFAVLIPLLTMKLFSDDKRNRTDQILLTSPVSILGIVMGKYLAALTVFGATFVVNSFNFVLLFNYGTPNLLSIFMNILGVFLLGAAFIAIGIFLSSLTESQLIAAVSAMGVNAAMLLISMLAGEVESSFLRTVVKWFSVMDRFTPFTNQMLDVSAIVYYISLAAVAIFLTTRVLEKRRWA